MATRTCLGVGALVVVMVLVLAAKSPVPSEDGVSYLWLAQQFAGGQWRQALASPFPPGWPLLLVPFLWLGGDPEWTAAAVAALCLAVAVVPLARLADSLQPGAGVAAAWLWVGCGRVLLLGAEGYSEPPFLLLMALGTWWGTRARWWLAGWCAGAAFWIRPEGLLLAFAFVLVQPAQAWRSLVSAHAGALVLVVLHSELGWGGLPLHEFHLERDDLPERAAVFSNLLAVPAAWFEAFVVLAVLALLALWRPVRGSGVLWWQIALQIGAVVSFVVRRRFFLSSAVAVTALAAIATARLRPRWRRGVLALAVVTGVVTAFRSGIEPDRAGDRHVGVWLRDQLRANDALATDLPRVAWYAGQPPGPPRHFTAAQWLQRIAASDPRFVVFSERTGRGTFPELAAGLAGSYERLPLPDDLTVAAAGRGIAVFVRR